MKFMKSSKNKLNTSKNKLNSKKNWFFKLIPNATTMCVVFITIGKGEFFFFFFLKEKYYIQNIFTTLS